MVVHTFCFCCIIYFTRFLSVKMDELVVFSSEAKNNTNNKINVLFVCVLPGVFAD